MLGPMPPCWLPGMLFIMLFPMGILWCEFIMPGWVFMPGFWATDIPPPAMLLAMLLGFPSLNLCCAAARNLGSPSAGL